MVQEIVKGVALQRIEPRLSEVRRNRLLLRHQGTPRAIVLIRTGALIARVEQRVTNCFSAD